MKKYLSVFVIGLTSFFFSCTDSEQVVELEDRVTQLERRVNSMSSVLASRNNSNSGITPQNPNITSTQPVSANVETTTIVFTENQFNFGELKQGEKASHTFKFKNTGDVPLVISSTRGSCGCTVPSKPDKPIAPGEVGEIEVQFDSKGKQGSQTKTVTVTANTKPDNTILTISANIIE